MYVLLRSKYNQSARTIMEDNYGGQLKTGIEQEAGEKIDWKR